MECFKVENLSFTYPDRSDRTLENINFTVNQGEFVVICGKSGCGKTTLLRLLKSSLSPFGNLTGNIYFCGKTLSDCSLREQSAQIGFVMQSCENQIVTDMVWHELAFGLESLGYSQSEIRTRVSEMASFFGIENWFYKNVSDLSGGQKQLLNLASCMAISPSVLILDEPTGQLDPIAAGEFLKTLEKINRELGVSVILAEHRLEDAFPMADRVIVMDEGKIIIDERPDSVGKKLKALNHSMYKALPTPVRVWGAVENSLPSPVTVREGRAWLLEYSKETVLRSGIIPKDEPPDNPDIVIEVKDAWFRYEKDEPDIIKGLSLKVNNAELCCLLGGNGTGKSTALSLISGLNKPYRGDVLINGKNISEISNLYSGLLGVLPQDPQTVFVKKTVYLDLMDIMSDKNITKDEKEKKIEDISLMLGIEKLLNRHPYDLSGGEQQRAALAKILLKEPKILLLDEPTKGMDAGVKEEFADIIKDLKASGVTILMVSHDIEFCAENADRCALVFDGSITSVGLPREFFKGNNFYTTSANRMARTCLPDAVLAEDIILACGGKLEKIQRQREKIILHETPEKPEVPKPQPKKPTLIKILSGCIFTVLFILTYLPLKTDLNILGIDVEHWSGSGLYDLVVLLELFAICFCFVPVRDSGIDVKQVHRTERKLSKRTLFASLFILLLVPFTIYAGIYFFGDRKYYFISLLIILETMVPFFAVFENRKPKARELIVISVLCAIAVAGRTAAFMLPQFKPVIALVIIAGVCFGGETGFLVGAVTGFVSNFFFGQGPWTPWQMFTFGIIGFVAGILFKKGFLAKTKLSLCIFGFIMTVLVYGGIMNPASVFMWQENVTFGMVLSACILGLPFDFLHALATAIFLWFIAEPMIEKLERVKVKYGLIN